MPSKGGINVRKLILPVIAVILLLLCGCGGNSIAEQLYENAPTVLQNAGQQPLTDPYAAIVPTPGVSVSAQTPAQPVGIGNLTPQGAAVSGYSADGQMYFARIFTSDGAVKTEYVYATATNTLLFQTENTYNAAGVLQSSLSQAVADKAYGYTCTDGTALACIRIATLYDYAGRQILQRYYDSASREVMSRQTLYSADGYRLERLCEFGTVRSLKTFAQDGALVFTSENGGLQQGRTVQLGRPFGTGTVLSVTDTETTLLFPGATCTMSDGTVYFSLNRYVVLNRSLLPTAYIYAAGSYALCEYRLSYAADGTCTKDYYEFTKFISRETFAADGNRIAAVGADGSAYPPARVTAPSPGDKVGGFDVCTVNADGSYVTVSFARPYCSVSGQITENATLYVYYDAGGTLVADKYLLGTTTLAEFNRYYNGDGSYRTEISENGTAVISAYFSADGTLLDKQTVQPQTDSSVEASS